LSKTPPLSNVIKIVFNVRNEGFGALKEHPRSEQVAESVECFEIGRMLRCA
jgi:hypothetical protein